MNQLKKKSEEREGGLVLRISRKGQSAKKRENLYFIFHEKKKCRLAYGIDTINPAVGGSCSVFPDVSIVAILTLKSTEDQLLHISTNFLSQCVTATGQILF